MNYNMKAHPTRYAGVKFRSRLEARWAAFFDLAGWKWEYEPIDLDGWTPDFRVTWPCGHSECPSTHTILAEVKPYYNISDFKGHPCRKYPFGYGPRPDCCVEGKMEIPADASAALGINPEVSEWEMAHGAGGGVDDITFWIPNYDELWKMAGEKTQYKKRKRKH